MTRFCITWIRYSSVIYMESLCLVLTSYQKEIFYPIPCTVLVEVERTMKTSTVVWIVIKMKRWKRLFGSIWFNQIAYPVKKPIPKHPLNVQPAVSNSTILCPQSNIIRIKVRSRFKPGTHLWLIKFLKDSFRSPGIIIVLGCTWGRKSHLEHWPKLPSNLHKQCIALANSSCI